LRLELLGMGATVIVMLAGSRVHAEPPAALDQASVRTLVEPSRATTASGRSRPQARSGAVNRK